MKLTIQRADLARVLTNVGRVVESRNTIPILGNVLLSAAEGRLHVTGTDLDIVATDVAPADVTTPGTVCVDAKLLADIAKKAGGDISISLEGDRLQIKSGRSVFKLSTLDAADFPTFGDKAYDASFEIDLASLFAPVAFAMSTEETRYYLNGVFLHVHDGAVVAVSTDGHRLSRHTGPAVPAFTGVIVPRKAVGLLPKGVVSVSVSESKIRISAGDFILTSKLIDGTFPDYQRVIPTANDKIVTFGSDDMRQAAGRVAAVSSERGKAVRLSLADGVGKLDVSNPERGSASDEIVVSYNGDKIDIGFNAAYLTELVGIFPAGDIRLALADSGSPAVFTSDKAEGLLAVLMPVRI
ncbi:DNA polymerase-3 subunit beta [Rhizobium leguminosarum]|uniref:DNA polymerase III subunit beta n=1 Tax=Rhizobium leguminosarum TaxID=384 RepID=UPI0016095AF8|nr:DNA polymerase III subunit beta [Rhizobium leguminosarum]MBB5664777.1 DNA polymerase-3 subunit beta [Rhizobium leguminosarum]